ncbi:amidohydrolase family protein [Paracrocinitomix mangrovi]|uniref:amidohydrolase family protein n=1 Tax=Paracrocinitomix mangrovi TaxID=2862509 RepID=UPI001EDB034B|nr:amidohydrolase family protein [Paracrocinitomix mangrovi]UKN03823.1 amidohydrolase family protein [Paracrocinitomix mangrovi]
MKKILVILVFMLGYLSNAQVPSPIEQTHKTILLLHGKAHIGNGEYVDNSSIGIKEGKILFVKNALTNPITESDWDTIIDITGKHVYPGFIAPNVTLGITEIDAVRATRDFNETGQMNPHVRSLIGYNTDSEIIYTVRTNGVLVTQSTPRGGVLSGTSSVMALDGWNWEDAVYLMDDGVHLNWPRKMNSTGWWAEPGPSKGNDKYTEQKRAIWDFFKKAQGYNRKLLPQEEVNLRYKALNGVFKGDKRIYIHADFAPEINDIIDFSREFNFKHPVIVGGYDAHMLANRLKENHFSVIIGRPHSLPKFEGDDVSTYYKLASLLQDKGVLFCISNEGDMEAMNTRNLPFLAGTAWAYGLSEEQAIAAISLNAAKILGLDDRIGSIEKGKDATLFVSDGNALDMRTNEAYLAMVKGRFIALTNHQIQLYNKYKKKYGLTGLE